MMIPDPMKEMSLVRALNGSVPPEEAMEVELPALQVDESREQPASQEDAEQSPAPADGPEPVEVCLEIQPDTDPVLVFRFCQSLQEAAEAEIAYFSGTADGIIVKLALRKHVPILALLTDMDEVERATQDDVQVGIHMHGIGSILDPATGGAVQVTLKAV